MIEILRKIAGPFWTVLRSKLKPLKVRFDREAGAVRLSYNENEWSYSFEEIERDIDEI